MKARKQYTMYRFRSLESVPPPSPATPVPAPAPEQLHTDEVHEGSHEPVEFVGLVGCLGVVALTDTEMYAWHVAGMDLCNVLNPQMRAMLMLISPIEVRASDDRVKYFNDWVRDHNATVWLAGPNADDAATRLFHVSPEHVHRTPQGPMNITFDPHVKQWLDPHPTPQEPDDLESDLESEPESA